MRGIILAGGNGTRLYPMTKVVSKQLLPVYDKPMIHYALGTLMQTGIQEILIICRSIDMESYKNLLGNGSNLGLKISYKEQDIPGGLAEAFIIGEEFVNDEPVCLILGDNIFHGGSLTQTLLIASMGVLSNDKAIIFGCTVADATRYGVIGFENGWPTSLEEKPTQPKSSYAVPGIYFYGKGVCAKAKTLGKSARGEKEITDLNRMYLTEKKLSVIKLDSSVTWFDCGTPDSLLEASSFIQAVQKRRGKIVADLKAIAKYRGWINA